MSRINKMSLEQLFKGIEIILGQSDILFFCNDESVIYEYYRIFEDRQKRDLKTFLAQHEDKIDKEKLIFCLYLNFQDNLKIIKNRIEKLQESKNNFIELSRLQEKEKAQSKYMQKIFELGRDTDVYSLIRKSSSGNFETEVISSKEIFKNQRFSEKRKLQRWREIDKEIGEDGKGSIFIIQTLLLSDLGAILPSFEVGMAVRESILNNCALKREGITLTKLNSLRESNYQEYIDFIDSVQPDEYLPAFREEIIKNIRFIDIDKVFLMICSRIQDCLERGLYSEKQTELISQMMIYLRGKIEDKKKVLKGKLQDIETYEEQEVEYSYNDLEQCIKRCIGNTYIKKSEVSKTKTDLLEGNIFLRDLEVKIINLIPLEDDEIEQIMGYHTENFVYGVKKLGYQESKIIEKLSMYPNVVVPDLVSYLYEEGDITISGVTKLYNNQKIDAEFFKEFSEETDISSEVNLQKIN